MLILILVMTYNFIIFQLNIPYTRPTPHLAFFLILDFLNLFFNSCFIFPIIPIYLRSNYKLNLHVHKKTTEFSVVFICLATSYSHRGKPPTTIGAKELNFRVRYGNGCDLFAIITRLFN